MTFTLKFSMKLPLPSEGPRALSEDETAYSKGCPIMHWERVDSSACRLSRSDDRVRSFAKWKGQESRAILETKDEYLSYHRIQFFLYLQSAELLSFIAANLCIDEFGQEEFPQKGTLKHQNITQNMSIIDWY